MAVEQNKDDVNFSFWRVVDENHPIVKNLNLDKNKIKKEESLGVYIVVKAHKSFVDC